MVRGSKILSLYFYDVLFDMCFSLLPYLGPCLAVKWVGSNSEYIRHATRLDLHGHSGDHLPIFSGLRNLLDWSSVRVVMPLHVFVWCVLTIDYKKPLAIAKCSRYKQSQVLKKWFLFLFGVFHFLVHSICSTCHFVVLGMDYQIILDQSISPASFVCIMKPREAIRGIKKHTKNIQKTHKKHWSKTVILRGSFDGIQLTWHFNFALDGWPSAVVGRVPTVPPVGNGCNMQRPSRRMYWFVVSFFCRFPSARLAGTRVEYMVVLFIYSEPHLNYPRYASVRILISSICQLCRRTLPGQSLSTEPQMCRMISTCCLRYTCI